MHYKDNVGCELGAKKQSHMCLVRIRTGNWAHGGLLHRGSSVHMVSSGSVTMSDWGESFTGRGHVARIRGGSMCPACKGRTLVSIHGACIPLTSV